MSTTSWSTVATVLVAFVAMICEGGELINPSKYTGRKLPAPLFPEMVFEKNAPHCIALKEPCGFYSFTRDLMFKWVKSWCKCSEEHECVFNRIDKKMRVFRQVCMAKGDVIDDDESTKEELFNHIINDPNQASQEEAPLPSIIVEEGVRKHKRHHHGHHHAHHQHHHHRVVEGGDVEVD